jgi:hypothetical protein
MADLHSQDYSIKIKQGLDANINADATKNLAVTGEPHFATDTKQLHIFDGIQNLRVVTADLDGNVGIGTSTPNSTLQVAGSVSHAYVAKTANYTLTGNDYQIECTDNSFTLSLPTAVGITGRTYSIKNSGTGLITVDGDGTETIDGELTQPLDQWDNVKIMSNGANWIII